jgi:hypothetical protein
MLRLRLPITLPSVMLKTEEILVDRHIRDEILRFYVLYLNHFAYQPGKSTGTALQSVVTHLEDAVDHRDIAFGTLDTERAF